MSEGIMDKSYVWQGEYGKRNHLIPVFSEILDNQDATSLTMLALFINNNPYNFEFFIALNYERPGKEHIQEMIEAFENAGLRYRSDLTTHSLLLEMGNRRFDSYTLRDSSDVKGLFPHIFYFAEKATLERKGYFMKPFGKDKQVFISYASKDKADIKKLIPYLNGLDLPVWFDDNDIQVGQSITGSIQAGIERSDMVIFWVTKHFIESKWCSTEMNAFIKKMIEGESSIFLMLDDGVEISSLPLFLRDIKHVRRENRSIPEIVEVLASAVKNAVA